MLLSEFRHDISGIAGKQIKGFKTWVAQLQVVLLLHLFDQKKGTIFHTSLKGKQNKTKRQFQIIFNPLLKSPLIT